MHLIHEYGLVAVTAIIGLECLGLPVPGETALLAAAIYAGTKSDLNINAVIVTAAGAAIAGRMIGYLIGHKFGSLLLLRYGHYVGLTTGRIKLGQYLFMRYGGKIIFFAQFLDHSNRASYRSLGFIGYMFNWDLLVICSKGPIIRVYSARSDSGHHMC